MQIIGRKYHIIAYKEQKGTVCCTVVNDILKEKEKIFDYFITDMMTRIFHRWIMLEACNHYF